MTLPPRFAMPMLARAERVLPRGEGWLYEPKWDGFRALITISAKRARIAGRNGGSLDETFPEISSAAPSFATPGTVLDGEIVVMRDGVLDFPALLQRTEDRPPATFVAFDIVADGDDVRGEPFVRRRSRLQRALRDSDYACITPQCDDIDVAERWFEELGPLGLEGVVAKLASDRYRGGKRGWVKVRRFETLDAVVGGYRGTLDGATSLLLGLYDDDGTFRYIGQTTSLPETDRARVARVLETLSTQKSFTSRSMPGNARWDHGRFEQWVPIEPVLVCEVSYSRIDHGFLRHPARILRWRPDKDARDCTVEP